MQLLVEALDDNGNVIDQKLVWLGDSIAPRQRLVRDAGGEVVEVSR